jgi:hypothetical protein
LYNDDAFVASAIKQWKNMVADVADEYNVKPEVLLANAIVQSYVGDYSKSALRQDAAQHAGDRVMSAASAAKRYTFGWTVQKMTEQHQLNRYFATEIPVASASADRMVSAKNSAKKGSASQPSTPKVTPNTQNNPAEEGFKNMVAKEYGFNTWSGLQRLADADMKADATRRVKSLMMAARIK